MAGAIELARTRDEVLAVLVLDVDRFKNINGTFGHGIGDEILVELAKRIGSVARREDTVARVGGDTFVIVMPQARNSQATGAGQRFMERISEPFRVGSLELFITLSIGVALFPAHGVDFDTLLKCADAALQRAKSEGGNQCVFFSEEMQVRSARNLVIETALRQAIERDELQLYYQPQVSLVDGRLTGAEALLRWRNPELGSVSPAEFIPIIEDSGQILKIGSWVLRSAADQLRIWREMDIPPFTMAVNVSSTQFRHPNLPGFISKVLEETGLDPASLELELTERVTMDDTTGAIAVMNELHELGVRISIDDFGTGYSSLSYLKRFRAAKLKIDQSFVRGLAEDPDDQAIVKAIINVASSLGIETIAEGVETAAQLEFLRSHGCCKAQGFYFSRPIPVEEFTTLARDTTRHVAWMTGWPAAAAV
jgi:diguanylate cyclase (GGDEF)-like protein